MVAHLGTAPDSVVAEWLGLDSRQVTYQRRKREIPAFVDPSVAEISNRLTPALLVKLKYMSASDLSAQTGICRNKLNKARKDLGISPRVPGRQPDPMLLECLGHPTRLCVGRALQSVCQQCETTEKAARYSVLPRSKPSGLYA